MGASGRRSLRHRWQGYVATGICVAVTCAWTAWGIIEMFHEGWYRPFEWLFFLLPAGVCLLLSLVALARPRAGGSLLVAVGLAFFGWAVRNAGSRYRLTVGAVASWFAVSGVLVMAGILFLVDARRPPSAHTPGEASWWRKNLRHIVAVGAPFLLGLGLSVEPILRVRSRLDDGYRGEREIAGNALVLIWAPSGPGWAVDTGSLTWNDIALYGQPPIGFAGKALGNDGQCSREGSGGCASLADMQRYNICRYVSNDGSHLLDQPQDHWRLPTTDELVRSLVRHGEHAGCTWDGRAVRAKCTIKPDKETPLWDPGAPVIYYWSGDEHDAERAYKVAYNGGVQALLKFTGLGSCGYRCVRNR